MLKNIFKKIIVTILTLEARLVLWKYKPHIVAVTGSVGKTSTKDAIYTALSSAFFVRKSDKSFNSEIGVPLTILGCQNAWFNPLLWIRNIFEGLLLILLQNHYPKWLVLEVGADRPGDIKSIASWLRPDIVVLTRFSDIPVHVEFFDSPEAVRKEKLYLAEALKKDGTLILNADDASMPPDSFRGDTVHLQYGFSDQAKIQGSAYQILYEGEKPAGFMFRIDHEKRSIPITIRGAIGRGHIYPLLAGAAVGVAAGVNLVAIGQSFASHVTPPGRMRLIEGMHETTLIDDTYNSSPLAAEEGVATLGDITTSGRKIVVFADMLELGEYSMDAHKKIGKKIAEVANILITVGVRSELTAAGAHTAHMKKRSLYTFSNAKEAGEKLQKILERGDIVLIKGSQSMRMERVVERVMAHPEQKNELLVRQEEEWMKR